MHSTSELFTELIESPFPSLAAIQDLDKLLIRLNSTVNPHKYIITEYFPYSDKDIFENKKSVDNYSPVEYGLTNLITHIEEGIIVCSDDEDYLESNMYNNNDLVLQAFLLSKVCYVGFQENQVIISFDDGYIMINY
jgi:hypothetical protein